jgi:hypothetical protein
LSLFSSYCVCLILLFSKDELLSFCLSLFINEAVPLLAQPIPVITLSTPSCHPPFFFGRCCLDRFRSKKLGLDFEGGTILVGRGPWYIFYGAMPIPAQLKRLTIGGGLLIEASGGLLVGVL